MGEDRSSIQSDDRSSISDADATREVCHLTYAVLFIIDYLFAVDLKSVLGYFLLVPVINQLSVLVSAPFKMHSIRHSTESLKFVFLRISRR